jgi:hypothetical protein
MYSCVDVKHRLLLAVCNETGISRQTVEEILISNSMKICPLGAELFCVEREREMNGQT